jgi:8-oxo-dGTP diphosphatase
MKRLAGCIFENADGCVLLLHRYQNGIQQWEVPGGKVQELETPDIAALREVKEEIGIEVKIIKLLGTKSFMQQGKMYEYFWFLADMHNQHPVLTEPEEHDQLRYFSWEELRFTKETLSSNVVNLVNAYWAGELSL